MMNPNPLVNQLSAQLFIEKRSILGVLPVKRPNYSRVIFSDGVELFYDRDNKRISKLDEAGNVIEFAALSVLKGESFRGFVGKIPTESEWLIVKRNLLGVSRYRHSEAGVLSLYWMEYGHDKGLHRTAAVNPERLGIADIFIRMIMAVEVVAHEATGI